MEHRALFSSVSLSVQQQESMLERQKIPLGDCNAETEFIVFYRPVSG